MEKNIYEGLITALITPFKNGKIDKTALAKLIEFQISAGVKGIVIGGSTGEGTSLQDEDYYNLIKLSTQVADKKINIIAGLSSVSTEYAVNKAKILNQSGINGIMCTVPHYIRPEQEGIVNHFQLLHDNTDLPLILYIHFGRTGIDLADNTILKLAECKRIVAIKDAGADIMRPLRLSRKLPSYFTMMSGNDENCIAYSSHGGKGCISVISNILPNECQQLQNYLKGGNYLEALKLQQTLFLIYEAMFAESNPIGIKYAAQLLDLCSEEIKLPLTTARLKTKESIKKILIEFGKI